MWGDTSGGATASYVITTQIAAPASTALATLATVRDELDIAANDTSNDTRLTRFINEESGLIARYCNRVFGIAAWQDEFRPQRGIWGEGTRGQTNPLKLTKWPLVTGNVAAFTGNTALNSRTISGIVSSAGVAGTAGLGLAAGQALYGPGIPLGTVIQYVYATSVTLSLAATATAVSSLTAPLNFSTGIGVLETIASTATWLVPGTDYQISTGTGQSGDEGTAELYRLDTLNQPRSWPAAQIDVWYSAGYVLPNDSPNWNLPNDLQAACLRIVVARFRARNRDPFLVERTQPGGVGTERYWIGAMPGQHGPYPNDIMAILDSYRVPVVA